MKKKGFSLMEILIALAILAGLATLILPNLGSTSEELELAKMRNDSRIISAHLNKKVFDYEGDYSQVFNSVLSEVNSNKNKFFSDSENFRLMGGLLNCNLAGELNYLDQDSDGYFVNMGAGGGFASGYDIVIVSENYPGKRIVFNSCLGETQTFDYVEPIIPD